MSIFRFKKFEIINKKSAMKVNTDGVLLGAATCLSFELNKVKTLDIGTGTGTIALMLAQRLEQQNLDFFIDAIDIDTPSFEEAEENFKNSPWAERMRAIKMDLKHCTDSYDLIVSNPPYFEDALRAAELRKSTARHTDTLSYRDIIEFAKEHLSENGRLSIILPADVEVDLTRYGRMCDLKVERILRIKTVPRKKPSRIIVEFRKANCICKEEELTIQFNGDYTEEYRNLVKDFYLWA